MESKTSKIQTFSGMSKDVQYNLKNFLRLFTCKKQYKISSLYQPEVWITENNKKQIYPWCLINLWSMNVRYI
jgi:hypothetical protein